MRRGGTYICTSNTWSYDANGTEAPFLTKSSNSRHIGSTTCRPIQWKSCQWPVRCSSQVIYSYSTATTTCDYAGKAVGSLVAREQVSGRHDGGNVILSRRLDSGCLTLRRGLALRRCSSVWTLIGSGGSAMVFGTEQRGEEKKGLQ